MNHGAKPPFIESYARLLIVKRNTSIGNVPMCSASQTAFSTVSDPLLESANVRKIHLLSQRTVSLAIRGMVIVLPIVSWSLS
jgi:hypothetical protein